jgi:HNH endonuclease
MRVQSFRTAVRARDSRCYISGVPANLGPMGAWWGFDVAHVFPLAYEGHWRQNNYGRWITIPPREGGDINSVQNGILLRSDLHQLFDNFALTINPDVCVPFSFYKDTIADNDSRMGTKSCFLLQIPMATLLEALSTKTS